MPQFRNVEDEYKKNKDLRKEDVTALMEWLQKQPHLPAVTELDAILFLQSCYCSNEAAKKAIDNFYTIRGMCPEFFKDQDARNANFKNVNIALYTSLKQPTPSGERVIMMKLIKTDPDLYQFHNQVKMFDMVTLLSLRVEGTAPGIHVVSDMAGLQFAHITKIGLLQLKKFFFYLQEAMPVRIKGLHFFNTPTFMDKVLSLIKPFMKKDLLSVLHVHSSGMDSLYKMIPQECLPEDYGGKAPSVQALFEKQTQLFLEYGDYFLEQEKMVVDESKRPGKPKSENDVFGVEGTFKKLDID